MSPIWPNYQDDQPALVQWTSNNGGLNTIRSYHAANGIIRESYRTNQDPDWQTRPIDAAFQSRGEMCAAVHKFSEAPNDVEIRLFFQGPVAVRTDGHMCDLYRTTSIVNHRNQGSETQFDETIGYVGKPRSTISWIDGSGTVQWRLYFLSLQTKAGWSWQVLAREANKKTDKKVSEEVTIEDIHTMYRLNTIHEAISSGPFGSTSTWSMGNNGQGIQTLTSQRWGHIGLSAIRWKKGQRISIFHWDNHDIFNDSTPGEIREMRWIVDRGWEKRDMPDDNFKNFQMEYGSVAAVTWLKNTGDDQIRLYLKWVSNNDGENRMVEFQGSRHEWTKQSADFSKFAAAGGPMAAVVWTWPTAETVHIRIHASKVFQWSEIVDVKKRHREVLDTSIGETLFDTVKGWVDGRRVDPMKWASR